MKLYEHTFTVRGKGDFPIDMLRYDSCYPATGVDAAAIEATKDRFADAESRRKVREIKLYSISRTMVGPTNDRWASFMWSVVEENFEPMTS